MLPSVPTNPRDSEKAATVAAGAVPVAAVGAVAAVPPPAAAPRAAPAAAAVPPKRSASDLTSEYAILDSKKARLMEPVAPAAPVPPQTNVATLPGTTSAPPTTKPVATAETTAVVPTNAIGGVTKVNPTSQLSAGVAATKPVPSTNVPPAPATANATSQVRPTLVPGTTPTVAATASTQSTPNWSTAQLLHPEYTMIRQTVKDLMALLQLYGPLTANQLEYNLPPVSTSAASNATSTSNSTTSTVPPWSVRDVLSILVALGLVQQVAGTAQYCMHEGIPRADAILPLDVPAAIAQAEDEAHASWKRSQILRAALVQQQTVVTAAATTGAKLPSKPQTIKAVLKQIVAAYPEVVQDPVYWTALRNCHIDVSPPTLLAVPEKSTNPSTKPLTAGTKQPAAAAVAASKSTVDHKATNVRVSTAAAAAAAIAATTAASHNLIGRVVVPPPTARPGTKPAAAPVTAATKLAVPSTANALPSTSGGTFGWKGGPSISTTGRPTTATTPGIVTGMSSVTVQPTVMSVTKPPSVAVVAPTAVPRPAPASTNQPASDATSTTQIERNNV